MNDKIRQPSDDQLTLEDVMATYLRAVDAGQAPDDEFLANHPQFATRLRSFLAAHRELARIAQPVDDDGRIASDWRPDFDTADIRILGDYELLEEIGRGGMGIVFKARQRSIRRCVALKTILAGSAAGAGDVQRFRDEAEAVASLDHPGIVPIFEAGQQGELHYYSMPLIRGISLAELCGDGAMAPHRAAQLVASIAEAVHYAHGARRYPSRLEALQRDDR